MFTTFVFCSACSILIVIIARINYDIETSSIVSKFYALPFDVVFKLLVLGQKKIAVPFIHNFNHLYVYFMR